MERTVPRSDSEDIALYIRTYYSLLRSSREVKISTLTEAHVRMRSALHVGAEADAPDFSAFIYATLRLPPVIINGVRLIVMGQSERAFIEHGYDDVATWRPAFAAARRRRMFYNGHETLGVYIASRSDIDDLVPILTAYQLERDKLHRLLHTRAVEAWLAEVAEGALDAAQRAELAELTGIAADDLERLGRIWGQQTVVNLRALATHKLSLAIRSLAGSLADYKRATRRWWEHVEDVLDDIDFGERPIYFVSSNTHSLANLLSGFALTAEDDLVAFIEQPGQEALLREYQDILNRAVPSSRENFLYYILKKVEAARPTLAAARVRAERMAGIHRIPSEHLFDIEVQVYDLARLATGRLDPRLQLPHIERLAASHALIVNIDFPLGMAAYQILSEMARHIAAIRGVYVMGKAATLNGTVGDVMIPSVVHDEHSQNTYLFDNCITAEQVAPHLIYGNVLDNQKAITVLGTFLQNREHMAVFYREGYTDMEMEAGPYLNCVYELVRPQRYPVNEIVHLHKLPFPVGIVHYASDTPMSKGKNLGAHNLSYFGIDATYAVSVAVLHSILSEELRRLTVEAEHATMR